MGSYAPDFTNGWWSLYFSPDGTRLMFGTSTNGGGMTNLIANCSWAAGQWCQIALTYSATDSELYVNGQMLASGAGVAYFPNDDEMTNGFRIGSDQNGNNQAGGCFDELESFNYPLAPANAFTHDSDIPDWWEVKYFNRTGLDPRWQPAGAGNTLRMDFQRGLDPNTIAFFLAFTNQYVNVTNLPVPVVVSQGTPYFMAVMVDPNPLTNGSLPDFGQATWRPYGSDVASLALVMAFIPFGSGCGDCRRTPNKHGR